jgi:type VI secretion system protein ImpF
MGRAEDEHPIIPSVLDRLLDDEPEKSRELPKSRHQVMRELKLSVRRDLENLLNTRWRCTYWPPNYDDLDTSLVNYGLPDFTGTNMSSAGNREHLRRVVEQVIRRFEPRFKTVRVELLRNADETDRSLRLRIDALLYAEPAPEPVVFDSQIETGSNNFEVKAETR